MRRELNRRRSNGVEVVLYWHGLSRVTLVLRNTATDERFELAVPPEHAMDAFRHPYAYLAQPVAAYQPFRPEATIS